MWRYGWNYDFGILEPSVAQPPLPLQLFLPLQPLSPLLQPPLPLQEFWPLQACFSGFLVVSCLSWLSAEKEALALVTTVDARTAAPVPASKPATAALVMRALVVLVMGNSSLHSEVFKPRIAIRTGTSLESQSGVSAGRVGEVPEETGARQGSRTQMTEKRLPPCEPGAGPRLHPECTKMKDLNCKKKGKRFREGAKFLLLLWNLRVVLGWGSGRPEVSRLTQPG
jgi:hypothetical protein